MKYLLTTFTAIIAVGMFMTASTALAAKPENILVCHVGNELGSNDESYQQNPDCLILPPYDGDPADYICPDAGKIDLILVSTKAKHIGNPAHSWEDDTGYPWEDYSPEDGIGDDPDDFEEGDVVGIDQGCELPEDNISCPCNDPDVHPTWVDITNGNIPLDLCIDGIEGLDLRVVFIEGEEPVALSGKFFPGDSSRVCASLDGNTGPLTPAQDDLCRQELADAAALTGVECELFVP